MGKTTKRFKAYIEESDGIRKKRLKNESRHNFKEHLKDIIEHEDWESLEENDWEKTNRKKNDTR